MGQDTSFDLESILARLQNRREFLQLFGKGLGYGALATMLPACGGGGGSSSSDEDSPVILKPVKSLPQALSTRCSSAPASVRIATNWRRLKISALVIISSSSSHCRPLIDVSALEAEIARRNFR